MSILLKHRQLDLMNASNSFLESLVHRQNLLLFKNVKLRSLLLSVFLVASEEAQLHGLVRTARHCFRKDKGASRDERRLLDHVKANSLV